MLLGSGWKSTKNQASKLQRSSKIQTSIRIYECFWCLELFPFSLEVFEGGVIFGLCRYTSFTANNAVKTARFSPARAIGRAPNARNVARRNSRRNSPPSRQPMRAAARLPRQNAAGAGVDPGAGVIELESFNSFSLILF